MPQRTDINGERIIALDRIRHQAARSRKEDQLIWRKYRLVKYTDFKPTTDFSDLDMHIRWSGTNFNNVSLRYLTRDKRIRRWDYVLLQVVVIKRQNQATDVLTNAKNLPCERQLPGQLKNLFGLHNVNELLNRNPPSDVMPKNRGRRITSNSQRNFERIAM